MKVSGFTFIRNAIKYDYPVVESITSILPLCDEFVVAAGKSEDETLEMIRAIPSKKIKVIETVWDDTLREGGKVLARETDKAFRAIAKDTDWAFYIQADEVVHERYLPAIKEAMRNYMDNIEVEGLLFNYLHFYGSYDFVGDSRKWYRKEVRIIRNDPHIKSYRDAQGFRKNGQPLKVKPVKAWIYHYGWVKPPEKQQAKQKNFNKYWHDDSWIDDKIPSVDVFDYSVIDSLDRFRDSHPQVMKERIEKMNWEFSFDPSCTKLSLKKRILHYIEKKTGWRIGEYRNYNII